MNLLGLLKRAKKQWRVFALGRRRAIATSPPLGGASEYFQGRSSDFAGSFLLTGLPRAGGSSVILGFSYLLTAAGQFRSLAGFPFHSPCGETVE